MKTKILLISILLFYPKISSLETAVVSDASLSGIQKSVKYENHIQSVAPAHYDRVIINENTIDITIDNTSVKKNARIDIPIKMGDISGNEIFSYQFQVMFDPNLLSPAGTLVTNTASENWGDLVANLDIQGELNIGAYSAFALTNKDTLINLTFDVIGDPGDTTTLTFGFFEFNDNNPGVNTHDGLITIIPPDIPDITVSKPNGGEDWEVDSSHEITWTSVGTSGTINIEYSSDSGSNWTRVATDITDDGSYFWTIPDTPSSTCLVKVSDSDGDPTDESDAVFTISPIYYTLTMASNPSEGGYTTPPAGEYVCERDSVLDISATPEPGFEFVNWTGDVADENEANTTITMTGDKTVVANFMQSGIQITNLRASVMGENLLLEWSAVDGILTYNVYRGTSYDFVPDIAGGSNRIAANITDEDPGTDGVQWTDTGNGADIVSDVSTNYFYKVTAVSAEESDPSNVAGEFDYELLTTEGTDINAIVVLLNTEHTRTPIATAEDLAQAIPYCTDVYWWDANGQGTVGHVKGLPFNDFDVFPGQPYSVSMSKDTIWTIAGSYSDVSFELVTTESTDINQIGVPLAKPDLTNADRLGLDIPNCTDVFLWDADGQGTIGHVVGLPFNNFAVRAGYPYSVSITAPAIWPEYSEGAENLAMYPILDDMGNNSYPEFLGRNIPHTVYGKIQFPRNISPDNQNPNIRAWITSRPGDVLFSESTGVGTEENYWWVSVSDFATNWQIGDSLIVEFDQKDNGLSGSVLVVLSDAGSDGAGQIQLTNVAYNPNENSGELPNEYVFFQNYPNPFNPTTMILFDLPQTSKVQLTIYNTLGQRVKNLAEGNFPAGHHAILWDATDDLSYPVQNGIYFGKFTADEFQYTIKMMLVK